MKNHKSHNFHKSHNYGMQPPAHLEPAGREFWCDMIREYEIADSGGRALLTTAAECLDRMRAAQAAIVIHGAVLLDPINNRPRVNPACGLEKDARAGFLAALKALNLDLEPLRDRAGRPASGS